MNKDLLTSKEMGEKVRKTISQEEMANNIRKIDKKGK